MSRLIKIIPDIASKCEPEGYEFGYYAFEDIGPIKTMHENEEINEVTIDPIDKAIPEHQDSQWELTDEQISKAQSRDTFCQNINQKLEKGTLIPRQPYFTENEVLKKCVTGNKQRFEATVVPDHLKLAVLRLAHNELGHNGSARTYMLLRRLYFWKGMKPQVFKYVKQCGVCQNRNSQVVKYVKGHFNVPKTPMDFISMDLIGEFHPPHNIYTKFGGSNKILSDNGTEFKNELFTKVADELGVEFKIYTPPYHPQSNGRIEGFHNFLKACISKHISPNMEWDDVVPLACAAYNFLPNEHSRESPFFLMFGRDSKLPLNTLLQPKIRYLGDNENLLSLEALKNIYQLVAENLKKVRVKLGSEEFPQPSKLKPGDSVLIKDHTAKAFANTYKGNY